MTAVSYEERRFINYLRGIAIFLMLWGHCIQYCCGGQFDFFEDVVFKTIYSFHMPLFMLISGFLFYYSEQKRCLDELIGYKVKSLLYPILMCSILNLLLTELPSAIVLGTGPSNLLGATPMYSLWFLWSVLSGSMVVGLVAKLTAGRLLRGFILVFGIVCVAILPCWEMNVYMYPYFVCGYLYSKHRDVLGKYSNVLGVLCLFIYVIMLFNYRKQHYIYTTGFFGGENLFESVTIDCFRWAIGLFGSVVVVWASKKTYRMMRETIRGGLEGLGAHSLAVYALSVPLLSYWLPKLADKLIHILAIDWRSYTWGYDVVLTPAIAVLYSAVLLLIVRHLKKRDLYELLFGR